VVDDDDQTRNAAQAAFEKANIPVRVVGDGRAALAEVAAQKPDVIVLELALKEPMAGHDVISLIKATMEWVDIRIVLYTRLPIESQDEALTLHGADDLVLKGPAAAEALVERVIQAFQREDGEERT
jgi:DNA-binding response OmpR family regulator